MLVPPFLHLPGEVFSFVEAGVLRNTAKVPFSREASAQRTINARAELEVVKKPAVLDFEPVSLEDILFWLLRHWVDQVVLGADHEGLHDERGRPLADAPVEGLSSDDKMVKCAADLLHGGFVVGSVAEDDVDVVQLHVFQRAVHGLHHFFARKSLIVDASSAAEEQFCCDDQLLSFGRQSADYFA